MQIYSFTKQWAHITYFINKKWKFSLKIKKSSWLIFWKCISHRSFYLAIQIYPFWNFEPWNLVYLVEWHFLHLSCSYWKLTLCFVPYVPLYRKYNLGLSQVRFFFWCIYFYYFLQIFTAVLSFGITFFWLRKIYVIISY